MSGRRNAADSTCFSANSTTTTTSSLFQPATTIYKFKSLAKYGYTLEEIDGEYCIFFLEYKSDPFKCFEDESEAIENFKFRAGLEEYRQGWEKELVDYPKLTEEEYNKSREFLDHKNVWNVYMTIEGKEYYKMRRENAIRRNIAMGRLTKEQAANLPEDYGRGGGRRRKRKTRKRRKKLTKKRGKSKRKKTNKKRRKIKTKRRR